MAVDFGTKRVGVAIGADGELLFSKTFDFSSQDHGFAELTRLMEQEEIGTLVFGLPLRMSGKEKEEARRVRRFAARLAEGRHIPVAFIDERLTTTEAQSILRERGLTDKEMRAQTDRVVAELLLGQYYRQRG